MLHSCGLFPNRIGGIVLFVFNWSVCGGGMIVLIFKKNCFHYMYTKEQWHIRDIMF